MLALSGVLCLITFPHLLAVNITAVKYKINGPPVSLTGTLEQNFELTKAKRFKVNELVGPESYAFYEGHIYTGLANGSVVDISGPGVRTVANMGPPGCALIAGPTMSGKTVIAQRFLAHLPDMVDTMPEEFIWCYGECQLLYEAMKGVQFNEVGVQECGRPLGLRIDSNGRLIVADAVYGIVRVNVDTGEKELLFSSKTVINGKQSKFINDVIVATDGTIYFTDSSTRWGVEEYLNIVLEGEASGRLMAYNETSNTTTVLVDNLAFADGVEFGPNEEYLLICETTRARIRNLSLKPGNTWLKLSTFADNLPGFPDNIRATDRGTFWVGFSWARHQNMSNLFDELASQPERTERLARTYSSAQILDMVQRYGMVVELNGSGEIIRSLQDPTGDQVSFVSEANEQDGCLYLGNVAMPYVSRVSQTTACHEPTRNDPSY